MKGSALLYTVLLLSLLLTVVLGLSTLISTRFEIMKGVGNSIVAYYAADAGAERMLNSIKVLSKWPLEPNFEFTDNFFNGATYVVQVRCKNNGTNCGGVKIDTNCNAENYCIKSVGTYKGAKRAIMVQI